MSRRKMKNASLQIYYLKITGMLLGVRLFTTDYYPNLNVGISDLSANAVAKIELN